jgi:hypothetical protein
MPGRRPTTATLIAVEIVRKNPTKIGFAANPRRWVVERFFAWIGRNPRLVKDFEVTSTQRVHSSTPPPLCCSCVGLPVLHDFRNDSSLACPPSALDLPLHPNFRVWRRLRKRHIRRNNGRAANHCRNRSRFRCLGTTMPARALFRLRMSRTT